MAGCLGAWCPAMVSLQWGSELSVLQPCEGCSELALAMEKGQTKMGCFRAEVTGLTHHETGQEAQMPLLMSPSCPQS